MTTAVISNNTGATYSGTLDVEIYETTPNTNLEGRTFFETSNGAPNDRRHTLISFTGLSNIPSGATITNVTFSTYLFQVGSSATLSNIGLFKLKRFFTGAATWNTYDGTNNWGTAGAIGASDYDSTVLIAQDFNNASLIDQYKNFTSASLIAYIQDIVNGTSSNFGFLFARTAFSTDQANGEKLWRSSEGTDGQRPILTVEYTDPSITGTINYTNANDTMAASGSTTIIGTSSTTNANDTIVASGSTTIIGTINTTNANDTMVASGTADSTITGTVSYTNNNDVMTAQGATPASTLFGGVGHFQKLNEYNTKRKQKAQESLEALEVKEYDAPIQEPVVIAPKVVKKRKIAVAEPIQITPDLSISAELRDEMIKEYLLKVQEQQEEEQAIVTIIMALV